MAFGVSSRWCFLANGTRGVEGGIRDESQESRCEQGTRVMAGGEGRRPRQETGGRAPPRATGSPGESLNSLGLAAQRDKKKRKFGNFQSSVEKGQGGFFWDGTRRILQGAETHPGPRLLRSDSSSWLLIALWLSGPRRSDELKET